MGGTSPDARNILSANDTMSGLAGELSANLLLNNGATGNLVQGNFLGTDITGTIALRNDPFGNGVSIEDAPGNTIGGAVRRQAGNLISGNAQFGIQVADQTGMPSTSSGTVIQGNLIGTDLTGTKPLGNLKDGVNIDSLASTNTGDLIGGTKAGADNTISGNGGSGIMFTFGMNNVVQGNRIGTDITGTRPLANAKLGIVLFSADNTIGGTSQHEANIIAANGQDGIEVEQSFATGNVIEGNFIGTDATGTINLGNGGNGISVMTSNTTVGGTNTGAGNTIAFNAKAGVAVTTFVGPAPTGVSILSNAIYSNGHARDRPGRRRRDAEYPGRSPLGAQQPSELPRPAGSGDAGQPYSNQGNA